MMGTQKVVKHKKNTHFLIEFKMMGEDRETAYNKAVTSIEEGLNEGEEVEVVRRTQFELNKADIPYGR